jgi:hypothetical protein
MAALLLGVAAKPVVHVHAVTADSDHHHDTARVHAHPAGHDHAPAPNPETQQDGAWTVDGVLSQPAAVSYLPLPAMIVTAIDPGLGHEPVRLVDLSETRTHDPPSLVASPLRAPPHIPPALS